MLTPSNTIRVGSRIATGPWGRRGHNYLEYDSMSIGKGVKYPMCYSYSEVTYMGGGGGGVGGGGYTKRTALFWSSMNKLCNSYNMCAPSDLGRSQP